MATSTTDLLSEGLAQRATSPREAEQLFRQVLAAKPGVSIVATRRMKSNALSK
jgi:hypothetical protein